MKATGEKHSFRIFDLAELACRPALERIHSVSFNRLERVVDDILGMYLELMPMPRLLIVRSSKPGHMQHIEITRATEKQQTYREVRLFQYSCTKELEHYSDEQYRLYSNGRKEYVIERLAFSRNEPTSYTWPLFEEQEFTARQARHLTTELTREDIPAPFVASNPEDYMTALKREQLRRLTVIRACQLAGKPGASSAPGV